MTWSLTRMAKETTTGVRYCYKYHLYVIFINNLLKGGGVAFIFALTVIGATGKILKAFQPPFGKLAAEQVQPIVILLSPLLCCLYSSSSCH